MTEKNIMVIPARKRVGSTAAKEKIKKLSVAPIAVFLQKQKNKILAMRFRSHTIQSLYKRILSGSLLASLQMMVSPVQTLKSVTNLIV